MLLKSLIDYYDTLVGLKKVPPFDMSSSNVGFAIDLNQDGSVKRVVTLREAVEGTNRVIGKQQFVPLQANRSSGKAPYFLTDKLQYVLGCKYEKHGTEMVRVVCPDYFQAFRNLHHEVLEKCDSEKARTVLRFVDGITPGNYSPVLEENLEKLDAKGTQPQIILRDENGQNMFEDPGIHDAWDAYLQKKIANAEEMFDLIDGKRSPIKELHGTVRGVGKTAGGISLISYNKNAFESYGLEHGENSPVSYVNEHKYVSALNYLFSLFDYVIKIGDPASPSMYITYWASNGNSSYQDIFSDEYNGTEKLDRDDLRYVVSHLVKGESVPFRESTLQPDEKFYVLGVSANAARMSVQLFYENSFGNIIQNVYAHEQRLMIEGSKDNRTLTAKRILNETVRQINGKKLESNPSPSITLGLYKAIMQNTRYPAAIFSQVMARINADHDIRYAKAQIVKAYLIKNGKNVPKEVLNVSLNKESNYEPYVLGRIFAVLEKIQKDSSPSINTTIKDRYIARAASDPVVVFPGLLKLSQSHQRKLPDSSRIYYSNLLNDLMGKLPEQFPKHLTLEEQGSFYLGYYQENQELYRKKSENKEEN